MKVKKGYNNYLVSVGEGLKSFFSTRLYSIILVIKIKHLAKVFDSKGNSRLGLSGIVRYFEVPGNNEVCLLERTQTGQLLRKLSPAPRLSSTTFLNFFQGAA
jgi:hypothetical protein